MTENSTAQLTSVLNNIIYLTSAFEMLSRYPQAFIAVNSIEAAIARIVDFESQKTENNIIESLEHLDGEALTQTLVALDKIREAKHAVFEADSQGFNRAHDHAKFARDAVETAIRSLQDGAPLAWTNNSKV